MAFSVSLGVEIEKQTMTSSFFSSLYSSSIFQSIPLRNFIQRYSHTSNKTMIGQVALFAGWILLLNAIDFSSTSPSSGLLPIKMLAQAQSDASAASKTSLPVGLMNLRNTCYMNAILQGLFSVKQFSLALTLQAYKFKRDSVGEEMTTLFQQMQPDPSIRRRFPIRPSTLAQKLKIDINIQEDAEELLLKILNAVDESLLEGKKKKKKNKADSANNLDISPPASSATDASSQKCTPATVDPETIDPLPSAAMKFDLQQTITCVHHKHASSEKLLEHFDLSIPFQGCKGFTEAIDQYFIPEMLTGENQYKCSVHGLQDAEKALKMATFPRVLIAHLKRFSFDPNTYQMKKVRTMNLFK